MRGDRFSFGYKKRVINRLNLFPGLDWTSDVDTAKIDHKQWEKINRYVNEVCFKVTADSFFIINKRGNQLH